MFQYKVCGISILSEISIPIFNISEDRFGECIKINCKNYPLNQDFSQSDTLFIDNNVYYQSRTGLAFKISNKSNITIYRSNNNDLEKVWETLIGLPIGYALSISGFSVLHGSAVSLKHNTACIIGFSGTGKSTLALSLLKRGCSFISEDLCVIKDKKIHNLNTWIKTSKDAVSSLKIKTESELKLENDLRNKMTSAAGRILQAKKNEELSKFLSKFHKEDEWEFDVKRLSLLDVLRCSHFLLKEKVSFDLPHSEELQAVQDGQLQAIVNLRNDVMHAKIKDLEKEWHRVMLDMLNFCHIRNLLSEGFRVFEEEYMKKKAIT